KIPIYKIGEEDHSNYIEIVELQERNSYDTSKPHKHEYIEIFLFNKGGGEHTIDFKQYPINHQSVHFVFPNQIHKVKRELNTHGHVILVSKEYFSGVDYELYGQFFHAFYLQPALNMGKEAFAKIYGLLDLMKQELQEQGNFHQAIVRDYIHILVKLFMRSQSNLTVPIHDKDFKLYMDLMLNVEETYLAHYPVTYYSEELQVSLRRLNTVCQKFHGATCIGVLHDRLILEAKKLLVHSDKSVKEVMFQLNYKDAAYFNRFFKKKTGLTPTAYQEKST
ncbi:MAG: helix-turn-helix domain-containing protein, partial [Salibacteraceae bacterium]